VLPIRHTDTPDSLQKRVQVLEHHLLPWTILQIAIGGVSLTPSEQASSILPALPLRLLIDA
ncbi:phosphoribosylglycinamide formyltransferase, partial [marine sediment metagenome]